MNRQSDLHPSASARIVDLFAGPGGWSEGLRMLGWSDLGIEIDENACATARAAGHERQQADVAALDPTDFAPCRGLIASPPCQSRSAAGKQLGSQDVGLVAKCMLDLAAGHDTRAELKARCADERSILTVEPLRWAIALRPEWIALEQVPPVLEDWRLVGSLLERFGYSWWAGILECERYGVPQTRERAVLMASRVGLAHPPRATHQRYVYGEPARPEHTLEGDVLPWISMAEALGWGMTERPGMTFAPGAGNGGAAYEGGSGARASLRRERARGAWVVQTGNFTAKHHRGERGVPYERDVDDPAPVVTGTVGRWTLERPATTIAGDSRVFQPGGHHQPGEQSQNAIRVTLDEAAALQSFRPGYPWHGTQGEKYQQIGNAVPPLLARAVLAELAGEALEAAA